MEAQFQIRQNALEAQDYMQDLLSWQQTLRDKSSKTNQQASADHHVPAVRGRALGTVASASEHMQLPSIPNKPAQEAAARASSPASHTYKNYSKWDKYDVEAALKDAESTCGMRKQKDDASSSRPQQQQNLAPAQPSATHSSTGSAAATVVPPPPPTAAGLKDRGNKLYQAGCFGDAVSCYTQSLELQASSVTYANRAMANIKLSRFQDAEQDCSAALRLDPASVKALHRRGTARKQLGKLLEAAADFEEALRLEPANKTLLADRNSALEQHLQLQRIPRSSAWISIPVNQQPAESIVVDKVQPTAAPTGTSAGPLPVQELVCQTQQGTTLAAAAPAPAADAPAAAAHTGQEHATAPAGVNATSDTTSNARIVTVAPCSSGAAGGETHPARVSLPRGTAAAAAAAAEAAASQLAARLAASLRAPRTSNDFEAAWRSFKGDEELQGKYLKLLSPQHLPTVFKTSLTAPILTAILAVALKAAAGAKEGSSSMAVDAAHAVALIQHMVEVPRFDMAVMCLTARDKAALQQLWCVADDSCNAHQRTVLEGVRAKYRL